MLTQDKLKELLDYDPATGVFRWRASPKARVRVGDEAGCVDGRYMRIQICGRRYATHRLAWLWMTGEWPADIIDHIDRNTNNNSWANLRAAATAQNAANRSATKFNKCGLKGVYFNAGKYYATIKKDGKSKNLGAYATPLDAHEAYRAAATQLFGQFARSI